jgi:hypothetical protein
MGLRCHACFDAVQVEIAELKDTLTASVQQRHDLTRRIEYLQKLIRH